MSMQHGLKHDHKCFQTFLPELFVQKYCLCKVLNQTGFFFVLALLLLYLVQFQSSRSSVFVRAFSFW